MKVSELTGIALDWAVAKCEGRTITNNLGGAVWVKGRHEDGRELDGFDSVFKATDWIHGGPIITDYISRLEDLGDEGWEACGYGFTANGTTPLIAVMRCYCCGKLGDYVDIPEELLCEPPKI